MRLPVKEEIKILLHNISQGKAVKQNNIIHLP